MIKSPNKMLKPLAVAGILFSIALVYSGAAIAADETGSSPEAVQVQAPSAASDVINSPAGELEGPWISEGGTAFSQEELSFSRNGNSYIGTLATWGESDPKFGFKAGDEVFRLTRVSDHVYKGEQLRSWGGEAAWSECTLGVLDNTLYSGEDINEKEPDSGFVFAKKK